MAQSVLLDRSYQVGGVLNVPADITVGKLLVTNGRRKEQKTKLVTADKVIVTEEKKQEIKTDLAPLVSPNSFEHVVTIAIPETVP